MLKIIISKDGFNLSIEKGKDDKTIKLGVYPDEDGGYGVAVDLDDLYRAVSFVMKDYVSEEKKEKEQDTAQETPPVV